MKRLLLPVTILLTTVLSNFSSVTFAQTADDSQPNSPNPEARDNSTPLSNSSQQKQKGYMGIQMVTLVPKTIAEINNNPDINFKVPDTQGVFIVKVIEKTPAATAGLRKGDVIKEISGESITNAKEVVDIVSKSKIGESLNLKIQRGEEIIPLSVELGEKPVKK